MEDISNILIGTKCLLEASLARILVRYENVRFGILTSWRENVNGKPATIEQKNESFERLKEDVHAAGFKFIPLNEAANEEECRLFVINQTTVKWSGPRPAEAFRWLVINLGVRYHQDCVIVATPDIGVDLIGLKPTIHIERHSRKTRPNILAQFYNQLRPDRKAEFDAVFTAESPKSWAEGMCRQASGETFVAACFKERQILEIMEYLLKGKR